jgi:hypothetical protein
MFFFYFKNYFMFLQQLSGFEIWALIGGYLASGLAMGFHANFSRDRHCPIVMGWAASCLHTLTAPTAPCNQAKFSPLLPY